MRAGFSDHASRQLIRPMVVLGSHVIGWRGEKDVHSHEIADSPLGDQFPSAQKGWIEQVTVADANFHAVFLRNADNLIALLHSDGDRKSTRLNSSHHSISYAV